MLELPGDDTDPTAASGSGSSGSGSGSSGIVEKEAPRDGGIESDSTSSSDISSGSIAGIVIGCVVAVFFAVAVLVGVLRKRRPAKRNSSAGAEAPVRPVWNGRRLSGTDDLIPSPSNGLDNNSEFEVDQTGLLRVASRAQDNPIFRTSMRHGRPSMTFEEEKHGAVDVTSV
jgi:hypothetical protein